MWGYTLSCLLVNHLSLLPMNCIENETTLSQSLKASLKSLASPSVELVEEFSGVWTSFSPTMGQDRGQLHLLANEKSNFKVLVKALTRLGGIPFLTPSHDMSNTLPTEKVMIACLSYMCHQLLLLRKESQAAVCIQHTWRNHARGRMERRRQKGWP